jgi:hypothetical protein
MNSITKNYNGRSRRTRGIIIAVSLLLIVAIARADGPNRAALVVVHGSGQAITRCVEFPEEKISGYELLERAGLDLNVDVTGGLGAAVCRIDGEGCTYPAQDCFCQCQGTSCVFWSYWQSTGGSWSFSNLGPANVQVKNGAVQGWVWGKGTPNSGASSSPPGVRFEDICQSPATATPTASPTPTVTATPAPTATPKPEPTPVIDNFSAERAAITAGESVTLRWNLAGAKAAYLRYGGQEEGVVSPGSKTVTPAQTTEYTLIAVAPNGGQATAKVTITVNPAPVAAAASQPVNQPGSQPAPSPTAAPTEAPKPVIQFSAAALTLPPGACTALQWDVQHTGAVFLDDQPVAAQGASRACPTNTTRYTLRAEYPGGTQESGLTLTVDPALAAAGSTPIPATATLLPTLTRLPQPAATAISMNPTAAPAVQAARPGKPAAEPAGWSMGAKMGLWGGLAGGWCVITLAGLAVWGGMWWVSRRPR